MVFRSFRRRFKRRNGFRKRFTRFNRFSKRRGVNRKRNYATTNSHGAISGFSYGGRRMGIRRWRRGIFQNTQYKPHYRSVFSGSTTVTTGTTAMSGDVERFFPELGPTVSDPFWTVSGGAVDLDRLVIPPNFIGDITLRGGKIGCSVTAIPGTTDSIGVSIFLGFTPNGKFDPNQFLIASAPFGWDPEVDPDFATASGKVLKRWTAVLNDDSPTLMVEHRVRPRKIDQATYLPNSQPGSTNSNQYWFVIHCCNISSAGSVSLLLGRWHNLSFSGDADI